MCTYIILFRVAYGERWAITGWTWGHFCPEEGWRGIGKSRKALGRHWKDEESLEMVPVLMGTRCCVMMGLWLLSLSWIPTTLQSFFHQSSLLDHSFEDWRPGHLGKDCHLRVWRGEKKRWEDTVLGGKTTGLTQLWWSQGKKYSAPLPCILGGHERQGSAPLWLISTQKLSPGHMKVSTLVISEIRRIPPFLVFSVAFFLFSQGEQVWNVRIYGAYLAGSRWEPWFLHSLTLALGLCQCFGT